MLSVEMNTTATLLIDEEGDSIDAIEGKIVSVSPGGIGLCAKRPVPPDCRLRMILTFVNEEGERSQESVQGWIVWQEEAPPFHLWGVIFPEMNERENPNLIQFLSEMDQEGNSHLLWRGVPQHDQQYEKERR